MEKVVCNVETGEVETVELSPEEAEAVSHDDDEG
jgi:hypothetical protein